MVSVSEASQLEIDSMMRRNSSPHILVGLPSGIPANGKVRSEGCELCRVCGDTSAKMHYGVLTCFGCKGFFRRALKRPVEYQCRHNGQCVVDKHERNSCRYCRFKKCLEVGMDPKAVRPDRDATGRHQGRARRSKLSADDEQEIDAEWTRKLPVDMRTTLMQLMNTDLMVNSGDAPSEGKTLYPLQSSLRQVLEDTSLLDGKRTEMRYEAFRQVEQSELPAIAHRRLLAVVDWVDHLFDMMDLHCVEDKMTLVKYGFAPLTVFCFSAATASSTRQTDSLCQCNYGYVPRTIGTSYEDPYHLANRVVSRSLDELVAPLRLLNMREEEVVLLKAIVLLNPQAKPLSVDASEAIADLRDRIQETLYHVVRETHPKEVASSRFGNLLLFLPSVYMIGNMVVENLQFVDSIMHSLVDPLMRDFLSLHDEENDTHGLKAEQVLDERPLGSSLVHSASTSSIDSLYSNPSSSSSYGSNGMPYNMSTSSLPGMASQSSDGGMNSATSLPNLGQMNGAQNMNDTDPDYNLTLTPDMFTGIRQAMSVAHNLSDGGYENGNGMDVDRQVATPPNSPQERPQFFISTVESTKHKFTVTTSFDRYTNYAGQSSGQPSSSPFLSQMNGGAQPQTLSRTNSLPPHQQFSNLAVYNQPLPHQQPQQQQYGQQQSMEYEENYYNQ